MSRALRTHLSLLFVAAGATLALATPAAAGVPDLPPRPVVVADGGDHRLAARGSYCWSRGRLTMCGETTDPMERAPTLPAPVGSTVTVRMGYPVERVSVFSEGEKLRRSPLDERRRRFELRLPPAPPGETIDLYIEATYDRGDGSFAIRIAPSE